MPCDQPSKQKGADLALRSHLAHLAHLQALVREERLELLGVVDLDTRADFKHFSRWLGEGRQAEMRYLKEHLHCRQAPQNLLSGAKVAIILGLPYDLGDRVPDSDDPNWVSTVAQYARFEDYHKVLRKKGERIAKQLLRFDPQRTHYVTRVLVDTAPMLERALASKTHKGFIGKNTCYIHSDRGSFFLLAEILTSLPLVVDKKAPIDPAIHGREGGCGGCKQCLIHCPTGALDREYWLDSRKCLAYWTIEHQGPIPQQYWPWLRFYYFGCDICQLVCPYNLKKRGHTLPSDLEPRNLPSLYDVATMDQTHYERFFGGTPMTRAKRNGLRRNALIAMTVTRDPRLFEAMKKAKTDPSNPVGETLAQIADYLDQLEKIH